MSNKYIQASDAIKTIANRFKGIIELGEALESIGSIEQATKEADAQLAKARKARDAFEEKFKAESEASAKQLQADAAESLAIRDAAKAEAASLKEKAIKAGEEKASKIVADANSQADAILQAARVKLAGLETQTAELESQYLANVQANADLSAKVEDLTSQYEKLDKALATLKAKFA